MRQFSGNTHETKVRDLEESLRKAANGLKAAVEPEKPHKMKAVKSLSKRLLDSQLKMYKARIKALSMQKLKKQDDPSIEVRKIMKKEKELKENGVEGILKIFGVQDFHTE